MITLLWSIMQKLTNLESRINMTRYPLRGTRYPVTATRTRVFHHAYSNAISIIIITLADNIKNARQAV